ncbi:DUF2785 domain-containing protein [Deinococcus cellulosilyticus]|uniref:Membrane protein n=1 Tax=Deinococcus cellulosilyticus (strain DSM 18568 / NBRC 106333 / KACC 11606 / 5516J-15) TaxID=1223518 RepID=A0A511MYP3_DEIC1|nr:DUF2785 domain-containing protein [Deinococcus cellulosilyticus]GEM45276.1 membrane protein [Deinococcus cellulosilyticus NBRC 106333 = KACC 11606]
MNRDQWQHVIDQDHQLPHGISLQEATRELLGFLSSTDPFLRDTVGYFTLSAWIERELYSPAELSNMLTWAGENLRLGLGTSGHDSVFLRSFSALILSEVVALDARKPFLNEAERNAAFEKTLHYLSEECDLRGYLPEKGWAHAVAHGADALMAFADHPLTLPEQLEQILETVLDLAAMDQVYLYNEEKRLARAAFSAITRMDDFVVEHRMGAQLSLVPEQWFMSPEWAASRLNLRGFFSALLLIGTENHQEQVQAWAREGLLLLA